MNLNLIASPGDIPTVSFSPGPIIVNYVLVSNPRDLTVSITVPASTPPGVESIQVTDGTLVNSWADFFLVINGGMIGNPSPSVWQRNQSGIITIPPNPLFQGQTHFVMDLGDGVSVGPITLQPDGTLQAPISVVGWASQGTRWIHLLAGPYTFISDRGFAVDFGPLTTTIQIVLGGNPPIQRGVKVPLGYTVSVFALPTARNGLLHPDNMFVDQFDTLYVLNPGPQTIPPNFTISMFDLSPSNYGAFKGLLSNFDASGLGGLLESAAMLPSAPGKIFVSTEDFPTNGFPGGNTITEVDTVTGASSLFFFNPNWTLDPIATDAQGNLVGSANINNLADPGDFYTLSPSGVVLGTCPLANWADAITRDPLSGKFLITGASTVGGAYTLDPSTCSSTPLTDGPELDEGAFGRDRGNFGNGYFVPPTGSLDTAGEVDTLMPAPYTDSVAEHSVPFIKFLDNPDGVAFDRDGLHLLVTDPFSSDVMDFHPDPTVTPEVALSSLSAHSLAFGSQNLNLASAAQTVTLSNTDVAPLTLAGIFITGDYTQTNDCGSSVAGGASCTISVVFSPTSVGDRTGTLTVANNTPTGLVLLPLIGTGQ